MRLRLLTLLLLAAPLACARTEVGGFPQGTASSAASSTGGTTHGSTGGTTTASTGGTVGTTGTTSTTTGMTGTTGTSGGGVCANCSGPADCGPGLQCAGGQQGLCLAPCTANGSCSDASQSCLGGFCFPSDFCLGGGSSGTVSTSGTSGGCDLQTCFTTCSALNQLCDPNSCTCQAGGSSGTSGGCDLQTCYQTCAAVNQLCDPNSCTCQSGGTTGSTGTTSGCDLQACYQTCAAQGAMCDPTTCACSGGGMSSGMTSGMTSGTTGTTTGSTSGTTGGGDCRTTGCGYGETCQQVGRFSNPTYACVCQPAGGFGTDSCAGNPSGQTVCDSSTLQCRFPRDFESCSPAVNTQTCATGYACVPQPSGGGICLQNCTATTDCNAAFTKCSSGFCVLDTCGPGSGNGDYYQSCAVATSNDGYCQPVPADGGIYGLCVTAGSIPVGSSCPGLYSGRTDQCVAGAICLSGNQPPPPDGGSNARCYEACNASFNPGSYAKGCGGFSQCYPDSRNLQTNPDPGLCFP